MKVLRITGVPEHFNFPWTKVIASQPFLDRGIQLEWIEESRGSGQMNKALREHETDLAIVLTESFLKDFEAGNPSKMIGFHVTSPLNWGIHIHGDSEVDSLKEISNPHFLISRTGSGSHLMGIVLAKREQWKESDLKFKIVDNLPGALKVMNPSFPELFLWEKYTTKPWVDRGELKRIGEIPSPWPCFLIAATNQSLNEYGDVIFILRDLVYQFSKNLKSSASTYQTIAFHYDLKESDVQDWMSQTTWAFSNEISKSLVEESMSKMCELGILNTELDLKEFLTTEKITLLP